MLQPGLVPIKLRRRGMRQGSSQFLVLHWLIISQEWAAVKLYQILVLADTQTSHSDSTMFGCRVYGEPFLRYTE